MTKKKMTTKNGLPTKVVVSMSTSDKKTMNPKRKARNRKGARGMGGNLPQWLRSVMDPFGNPPTAVPDSETQMSCKCVSRFTGTFTTTDRANTPTSLHGALLSVTPWVTAPYSTFGAGQGWITVNAYDSSTNSFLLASGPKQVLATTPPNAKALFPPIDTSSLNTSDGSFYQHRMTALKIRIFGEGTELYRSGRITAGLAELDIVHGANNFTVSAVNNNGISMVSNIADDINGRVSPTEVTNRMRRFSQFRNPDGSVELTWIPTGVPAYAPLVNPGSTQLTEIQESGPVAIIMIEGDQTASASSVGNTFSIEAVAHWEYQPASRIALAVPVTPSDCDFHALSTCLNAFEHLRSTTLTDGSGTAFSPSDGAAGSSTACGSWCQLGRGARSLGETLYQGLTNPQVYRLAGELGRHYRLPALQQ